MTNNRNVIIGCGDVGRRIVTQLIERGSEPTTILGLVRSEDSVARCKDLGIKVQRCDFDADNFQMSQTADADCYYLVPPQKTGVKDLRTRSLLAMLSEKKIKPRKLVLVSTTGVYGDYGGKWVTEESTTKPKTDRGKRRLDSETQWSDWCNTQSVNLVILRVPGIYARSRIPRQRIENRIPVVNAHECGFTNRIHADDLAAICIAANNSEVNGETFNVTDGTPGKITDYIQAAALELNLPIPPTISMQDAQQSLSDGMLSYLSESRKISNTKMLDKLKVTLRYPDFREGLKFG